MIHLIQIIAILVLIVLIIGAGWLIQDLRKDFWRFVKACYANSFPKNSHGKQRRL